MEQKYITGSNFSKLKLSRRIIEGLITGTSLLLFKIFIVLFHDNHSLERETELISDTTFDILNVILAGVGVALVVQGIFWFVIGLMAFINKFDTKRKLMIMYLFIQSVGFGAFLIILGM